MDALGRPEHAVLLILLSLGELGLGVELLPLALASLELLGSLDLLGLGLRLARIAKRRLPALLGELEVDASGGRDDAGVRRGRGRGGRGRGDGGLWRSGERGGAGGGRAVGLALLGDGPHIPRSQLLGRVVALEPDDVDGIGGGAGDGSDAGRIEAFVTGHPLSHDIVVDLVVDGALVGLLLLGRRGLLEGRVVLP